MTDTKAAGSFRECAVCGIRCFQGQDDLHPLPRGGGYCNRCADEGGYGWLAVHVGVAVGRQFDRNGFTFCPGHDDGGRPNLHLTRADRDQRDAVLFCHAGCGSDVDRILGAIGLSRWHLYHPDNKPRFEGTYVKGSRVKGQGQRQDVSGPKGANASSTGTTRAKNDEAGDAMDERLDRYRAGLLEPEPVSLPVDRLPAQAKALRALVAEIELWMGLRLADFDYRPLPLSTRFVARRMGWLKSNGEPDGSRGWKALRALVERGVLVPAEPLEGRGDWPGTRTFLPPEPLATTLGFATASDDAIDGGAIVVEPAVPEPDAEVAEQPRVDGTEVATGQDDGMVAVRFDAAGDALASGHAGDYKRASGGSPRCAIFDGDDG